LFLDEVSDLFLSAQAKLVLAIQDIAGERVGGNGTHRIDGRRQSQSRFAGRAAALSAEICTTD
jgi:DNA-binding NtrC family response regulator